MNNANEATREYRVSMDAFQSKNRWTRKAAGARVIVRNRAWLIRKYPWFEEAMAAFLADPDKVRFEHLLHNGAVFSARVIHIEQGNDASRLIFHMRSYEGKVVLYFLGVVVNHRYNRLLKNIPNLVQHIEDREEGLIDASEEIIAANERLGWVHHGSVITKFTAEQEEALACETLLAIGPVGSGKSLIAAAIVENARQQAENGNVDEVLPILYVATSELARFAAAEDRKLVADNHPLSVQRFDYCAFITWYLGKHVEQTSNEVINLLAERIARDKNLFLRLTGRTINGRKKQQEALGLAELVYQEMRIIGGYTAEEIELYFVLGERQSYFPAEQRPVVYELFQHYSQNHGQKINYDFYILPEELILQKPPVRIIGDEIQLMSLCRLRNLVKAAASLNGYKQLHLVGDNAQNFSGMIPVFDHLVHMMQRMQYNLSVVKLKGSVRCPLHVIDFLHHYQEIRNASCGGIAHVEAEGEIIPAEIENSDIGEVIWWNGKKNDILRGKIANYLEHSDVMVMVRDEHRAEVIKLLNLENNHKIRIVTPEAGVGLECKVLITYKLTWHEAFYEAQISDGNRNNNARVKRQDLLKQRNLPFWNLVLSAWGRPTGSLIVIEPHLHKLADLHQRLQEICKSYQQLENFDSLALREEDIINNAEQMYHLGQQTAAREYLLAHKVAVEFEEPEPEVLDLKAIITHRERWDELGFNRYLRQKKDFIQFWRDLLNDETLLEYGMTLYGGYDFLCYCFTRLTTGLERFPVAFDAIAKIVATSFARQFSLESVYYGSSMMEILVNTIGGKAVLGAMLSCKAPGSRKSMLEVLPWLNIDAHLWRHLADHDLGIVIIIELLQRGILYDVDVRHWLIPVEGALMSPAEALCDYWRRNKQIAKVADFLTPMESGMDIECLREMFMIRKPGDRCLYEIFLLSLAVCNLGSGENKVENVTMISDNDYIQMIFNHIERYPDLSLLNTLVMHAPDIVKVMIELWEKDTSRSMMGLSCWQHTVERPNVAGVMVLYTPLMEFFSSLTRVGSSMMMIQMLDQRRVLPLLDEFYNILNSLEVVMNYYAEYVPQEFSVIFYQQLRAFNLQSSCYPQLYFIRIDGIILSRELLFTSAPELPARNLLVSMLLDIPIKELTALSMVQDEKGHTVAVYKFTSIFKLMLDGVLTAEEIIRIAEHLIIAAIRDMHIEEWAAIIMEYILREVRMTRIILAIVSHNEHIMPSLLIPLKGPDGNTLMDSLAQIFTALPAEDEFKYLTPEERVELKELLCNFLALIICRNPAELERVLHIMRIDTRKVAIYFPILERVFSKAPEFIFHVLNELPLENHYHDNKDLHRELLIIKMLIRNNNAIAALLPEKFEIFINTWTHKDIVTENIRQILPEDLHEMLDAIGHTMPTLGMNQG